MRVLHVVKTSDGADWAANQVAELVRQGIEVHVAIPHAHGRAIPLWERSGARIHVVNLDFPVKAPWNLQAVCVAARKLVSDTRPDIIHSHFFATTMILRAALRRSFSGPIVFQVPGPLHLEHTLYRAWDTGSAGLNDYWIASSRYILSRYCAAKVSRDRVFLSYHGGSSSSMSLVRTNILRSKLDLDDWTIVVGNVNFMYPPKHYLGHAVGLKCHEDVIDALSIVTQECPDVVGVLVGGSAFDAPWYEDQLRARAFRKSGGRVRFAGYLPHHDVVSIWQDFDIAVHVPLSENCGGVLEPLLAGIPTIAGRVGGLPELVVDGITGKTVAPRNPRALAQAIQEVISDLPRYRALAMTGRDLVSTMFNPSRTAREVHAIYEHLLDPSSPRPTEFDSMEYLARLGENLPSAPGRPVPTA